MKIIENAKIHNTDQGIWEDIQQGYFKPEDYLEGRDLEKVLEAIETLEEFFYALYDAELVEEY